MKRDLERIANDPATPVRPLVARALHILTRVDVALLTAAELYLAAELIEQAARALEDTL